MSDESMLESHYSQERNDLDQACSEVDRLRAELAETRAAAKPALELADALLVERARLRFAGDELARAVRYYDAGGAIRWSAVQERAVAWRSVRGDAPAPAEPPDTELAAAVAWFREDPKRLDFAPITEWSRHLRTIVRAYFARPAAGRDLTAQDVGDAIRQWNVVPGEPHRDAFIADYLNGIARPADNTAVQGWGDVESADFIERARAATAVGSFTAQFDHVYDPSGDLVCESADHSTAVRIAAALSAAPADDTAAPDGPPTTITVTLPAAEHDIDGEDAHGRWTQNPAWETRGIEFGVISAWAQGVCIEDVLHDEGDVIELEETARKVLAAVEQHRYLARRLAAEGSDS